MSAPPDWKAQRKVPGKRRAGEPAGGQAAAELREDPTPFGGRQDEPGGQDGPASSHPANRIDPGRQLRFIDLFCGIGGFRIAFERAGCRCVFSSDWDKHSQLTYAANLGETPHGDIHDVAVADIPKFDILCAGFPCQPFSIAGVSKKLSLGRKRGLRDVKRLVEEGSAWSNEAMPVQFDSVPKGSEWDRNDLANLWGYRSFHALARGVFTPAGQRFIVLFVTEQKQESLTQYDDRLVGKVLHWEGEDGHQNDLRIAHAGKNGDEIHVFYRGRHHEAFHYLGKARVNKAALLIKQPSQFELELV